MVRNKIIIKSNDVLRIIIFDLIKGTKFLFEFFDVGGIIGGAVGNAAQPGMGPIKFCLSHTRTISIRLVVKGFLHAMQRIHEDFIGNGIGKADAVLVAEGFAGHAGHAHLLGHLHAEVYVLLAGSHVGADVGQDEVGALGIGIGTGYKIHQKNIIL